jgi:hypothetical protein
VRIEQTRRVPAWIALLAGAYLITPPAVAVAFCVYWVVAKRDPDGPFAVVAWAVWCFTGFAAFIALIAGLFGPVFGGGLESPLWAVMAVLVLSEFFYVPLREGGMAEFRRHMELYNEAATGGDWQSAAGHARMSYKYANRIRWSGGEPRAAACLLIAQSSLMLGDAAEAERMATEALPQFDKAGPIEGIPTDLVYGCRAAARAMLGDTRAAADYEQAIRLRRNWAGDDETVRAWLQALGS